MQDNKTTISLFEKIIENEPENKEAKIILASMYIAESAKLIIEAQDANPKNEKEFKIAYLAIDLQKIVLKASEILGTIKIV